RLYLAVARKGVLRILGELLHPIAQLRRVNVQVLRCLHIGHASILDQAHGLKLELPRELPSLHDPPPAPSKHLTRCLRNRVQASCTRRPVESWPVTHQEIRTRDLSVTSTGSSRKSRFSAETDLASLRICSLFICNKLIIPLMCGERESVATLGVKYRNS